MIKKSTPDTESRSMLSVYACSLMVLVSLARVQEIFPALANLRPALLTSLITFFLSFWNGRIAIRSMGSSKESKLIITFWLIGMVSIIFSVWPGGSFDTWRITFTSNALVFFCCLVNMQNERELSILNWSVISCALILALATLVSPAETRTARAFTTTAYDPNDLAMTLVAVFPLVLATFLSGRPKAKIFLGVTMIIMVFALLKTGSRGGFIGFAAVGIFFLFAHITQVSAFKKYFILALTGSLIYTCTPDTFWDRFGTLLSGEDYNVQTESDAYDNPGRLEVWMCGLDLLQKNPILGVGAGQFSTAMGQTYGRYYWVTAHNTFLQVALELGLPGFLIFLSLLVLIWRNCQKARLDFSKAGYIDHFIDLPVFIRIAVLGYVVCGLFLSQAYSVLVPLLIAYSAALAKIAEKKACVETAVD